MTQKEQASLAIYNINKIAKKYRDKATLHRERIYNEDNLEIRTNQYGEDYDYYHATSAQHNAMKNAKGSADYLYSLKDKFLKLSLKKFNLEILGYHEFVDGNRDYIEWGGYSFHFNFKTSLINLGKIKEEISSEKKGKKLSLESAKKILNIVFEKELKTEKREKEKEEKRLEKENDRKRKIYLKEFEKKEKKEKKRLEKENKKDILEFKKIKLKNEKRNEKMWIKIRKQKRMGDLGKIVNALTFGGGLTYDWQFESVLKALKNSKEKNLNLLKECRQGNGRESHMSVLIDKS